MTKRLELCPHPVVLVQLVSEAGELVALDNEGQVWRLMWNTRRDEQQWELADHPFVIWCE